MRGEVDAAVNLFSKQTKPRTLMQRKMQKLCYKPKTILNIGTEETEGND